MIIWFTKALTIGLTAQPSGITLSLILRGDVTHARQAALMTASLHDDSPRCKQAAVRICKSCS